MTRMIKLSIAPATETECGHPNEGICPLFDYLDGECSCFPGEHDPEDSGAYPRLPACIAAEVGAEGRNS